MTREKYVPALKEIQKAEGMMTPEQKQASEEREKFFIQEREPFEDIDLIDQNQERKPLTPEERREMDENLKKLGRIFFGSDVKWQLDGALNISLMKGEYIGVHKDVDVSVEADDLEKLDAQLLKNGYGLFLSYRKDPGREDGKMIMKRAGARGFRQASGAEHFMIAAIDERGKIIENQPLNFIDVHLVKRNKAGNPVGPEDAVLPEEWMEPQPVDFLGETINISHPARVAYYKLFMTRDYDRSDLKELAGTGNLSMEDIDKIEEAVKQGYANNKERGAEALRPVWERINADMSAEEIFNLFSEDPRFSEEVKKPDTEKLIRSLSEYIAEEKSESFDDMLESALRIFGAEQQFSERLEKVEELRKWAEDAEEKNRELDS